MFGPLPRAHLIGPALLIVAGCLLPLVANQYQLYILNTLAMYAVLAIGLDILVGRAGQFAFSHIAFFGIGAYTTAALKLNFGVTTLLGVAAGMLICAAVGALIAFPATRLKSIYLALATFGFAQAAHWIFQNWITVTGGPDGLRPGGADIFGLPIESDRMAFRTLAIILTLTIVATLYLMRSRLGRSLTAIRDSEHVAAVSGISVRRTKIAAFTISSAYAGLAGGMLTMFNSFIHPDNFGFAPVVLLLSMLVVGGMGSLPGTLLGVVVIGLLPELLRTTMSDVVVWQEVVYGVILVGSIMFMPNGVWHLVKQLAGGGRP
ncbi:branched-chain amino acid ABC transporter permease [Acuticoccus sp. I52.16.1]|uniref:branched-chain amino acid ABC transporter permease n=1 Tax=Acuticoccus sp. I52.16.1 TaxID=2928472 RepID=UPI001FD4192F|nr:branched-chain amino acid ABC transporter permease [Acuticoccus sp. I52.16.1]UOM36559.1 branched-chain amino acid ABC transporter permease [Acuticoccus sp. I52.16.1]